MFFPFFFENCQKNANPMVFTAFCGRALRRALCRALCVHCTCTVRALQNTQFVQFLLLEGWRNILCLWVAAVKMKVCLDWVLARANGNLFKLAFAAINPKRGILCFFVCWVEAFESVIGLLANAVCSSLCLHIHQLPGLSPGSSKKTLLHLSNLIAKNTCMLQSFFPANNSMLQAF